MIRISRISSLTSLKRLKCINTIQLSTVPSIYDATDTFETRHMGSHGKVKQKMLDYSKKVAE